MVTKREIEIAFMNIGIGTKKKNRLTVNSKNNPKVTQKSNNGEMILSIFIRTFRSPYEMLKCTDNGCETFYCTVLKENDKLPITQLLVCAIRKSRLPVFAWGY